MDDFKVDPPALEELSEIGKEELLDAVNLVIVEGSPEADTEEAEAPDVDRETP